MPDDEIAFYRNPKNIKAGARVPPTTSAAMKGHVPVRFSESVIARVKTLAANDGVTVSTWTRNLVIREIERRTQPRTVGYFFGGAWETELAIGVPTAQSVKAEPDEPALLSA
jgi:hypothetical protein